MSKQQPNKKLEPKKPKFSAYWIYGAIIIIFLGINFIGGSGFNEPAKTNPAEFESYLKAGDVKKVIIVNRNQAKVYLTEEAKAKDIHKKAEDNELFAAGDAPDYSFEFGDLQNFENNIQEIKAREGKIIAVVTQGDTIISKIADHVIEVPYVDERLSPLVTTIPLQLISYHIAVMRECNVDQPRNLAKSVTVE